ncbi:peroxidase [Lewinellaceae bacterium SD302]|nr:peroxidase [Lewinellaceae bacterium SD302]
MPYLSHLSEDSDFTDILFRDPDRYGPMNAFTQKLLRGPSELTVEERELIAAFVSATNSCQYCHGIHAAVAQRFGTDPDLVQSLVDDLDGAPIDNKLRAVLHFARKLTLTPAKIVAADAEAVLAVGWSERSLEDVIGITALFNYYNRILDGHGIKGNANIFSEGSGILAKRGYKFPKIVAKFLYWRRRRKDSQ